MSEARPFTPWRSLGADPTGFKAAARLRDESVGIRRNPLSPMKPHWIPVTGAQLSVALRPPPACAAHQPLPKALAAAGGQTGELSCLEKDVPHPRPHLPQGKLRPLLDLYLSSSFLQGARRFQPVSSWLQSSCQGGQTSTNPLQRDVIDSLLQRAIEWPTSAGTNGHRRVPQLHEACVWRQGPGFLWPKE